MNHIRAQLSFGTQPSPLLESDLHTAHVISLRKKDPDFLDRTTSDRCFAARDVAVRAKWAMKGETLSPGITHLLSFSKKIKEYYCTLVGVALSHAAQLKLIVARTQVLKKMK